jgi:hypothetical protein
MMKGTTILVISTAGASINIAGLFLTLCGLLFSFSPWLGVLLFAFGTFMSIRNVRSGIDMIELQAERRVLEGQREAISEMTARLREARR